MIAQIVEGRVYVPVRVEGPNGLIADGLAEVLPTDAGYEAVMRWIQAATKREAN
jgi:hypothetical protein